MTVNDALKFDMDLQVAVTKQVKWVKDSNEKSYKPNSLESNRQVIWCQTSIIYGRPTIQLLKHFGVSCLILSGTS